MRTIKFRIWDNLTNEMHYDALVGNCRGESTVPCVYLNEVGWAHTDNCVVEQFTGLLSQDKQDIYEGDRLFDYDDDYYVVEFSEGRFVAVGDGFEVDLFEIADRCSVIGNIHDSVDECIEPTKLICKSCGRSIEFDIDNEYKPDTCYECGQKLIWKGGTNE